MMRNGRPTQATSIDTPTAMIPAPTGRRSRNFNIRTEMEHAGAVVVSKATYKNLIVS